MNESGHMVLSASPREIVRDNAIARAARPGDEDAIAELFLKSFDGWPPFAINGTPREFLDWYYAPHSTTQGMSLVVEIDGQIVAASTRILRPARVGGVWHPARLGGYVATDAAFRGRGVYRLLAELGDSQPQHFAWHLTQVASLIGMTERRGVFPLTNPFEVHVAVLGAPELERPLHPRVLAKAAIYWGVSLYGTARRLRRAEVATCSARRVSKFDARVTGLADRAAAEFYFFPLRDEEFLNWRYCDPRAGTFTVAVAEDGDALLGYVVLRTDGHRAHVVDLLVDPSRSDALHLLVDTALEEAQAAGCDSVECWMFHHHPYRAAIEEAGFVRFPSRSKRLAAQTRIEPFGVDRTAFAFLNTRFATLHIMEGDTDLT